MSKVPCKECGTMILESTYEKNAGLCFPCKRGTRELIEEHKSARESAKNHRPEPEFICLECGSKRCRSEMNVNPIYDENDPWSNIASRDKCWDCGAIMPRSLSRRWNHTYEEAKRIWVNTFRGSEQSNIGK